MNRLPTKFFPPFLTEPRTRIPRPVRNWLGSFLLDPPRGPRLRHKQACVLALGRIGDFVLSLATCRLLARELGADQITLVLPPGLAGLAAAELPGVELIPVPAEANGLIRDIVPLWWRERPKFAACRYERRIALNHLRPFYHEIVLSWIDAKTEHALTFESYPAGLADGTCRELQAHRLVASAALARSVDAAELLPLFTRFTPRDDGRLYVYPLAHDGAKDLPPERVGRILRFAIAQRHRPVVLGGSPHDAARLERQATALRAEGLRDITVETPAGVIPFIEHLAAAGAVLSADSAAGHIATAFDKPAVVLMPEAWHGLAQPWARSARQHTFQFRDSDELVAAALAAVQP